MSATENPRRRGRLAVLMLLAAALISCAGPIPAAGPTARVLVARQVAGRTWDLTVDSPALLFVQSRSARERR